MEMLGLGGCLSRPGPFRGGLRMEGSIGLGPFALRVLACGLRHPACEYVPDLVVPFVSVGYFSDGWVRVSLGIPA